MLSGVTGILQSATESFRRRRKGFRGDRERGEEGASEEMRASRRWEEKRRASRR